MRLMTLIPAFKTKYLGDLLACLERQTVRPDAVLLSDDSPGNDFVQLLQQAPWAARCAALKLQVVEGPKQGSYPNARQLITQWAGRSQYVHMLCDDDVIYPDFYEKHLAMHAMARFDATISLRWVADEAGLPSERPRVPPLVLQAAQKRLTLDAGLAFGSTVGEHVNWFGEVSNAVLHAEHAPFILSPQLAGVPMIGVDDLACFLAASLRRPLGLLNESLGFFRTSPTHNTAQVQGFLMKLSTCAWVPLAIAAHRLGHVSEAQMRHCVKVMAGLAIGRYHADAQMAPLCAQMAACAAGSAGADDGLLAAWSAYARRQVPAAFADVAPAPAALSHAPAAALA